MKRIRIIFILLFPLFIHGQNHCDSILFKRLIAYSEKDTITNLEFRFCKMMVDSLDEYNCDYYYKFDGEYNYAVTSLTYLFGEICYLNNTEIAMKAYLDYHIKHMGSAEEQIRFSFEKLFSLQPKFILDEISNNVGSYQDEFLESIVWGFLNNRYLGAEDPFADNPFKAMTVYENPPEPILNESNYLEIFYEAHPQTKKLYPSYQDLYEYMFKEIEEYFDWLDEMNNESNR